MVNLKLSPPSGANKGLQEFKNALTNINTEQLGILYDLADSLEMNDAAIDFLLENLGSQGKFGDVACARALCRAEHRLEEVMIELRKLLDHDWILMVTLAIKAFSNFGPSAKIMLPEIFDIIKKSKKTFDSKTSANVSSKNMPSTTSVLPTDGDSSSDKDSFKKTPVPVHKHAKYDNIPLVRSCVVAIANICALPQKSAQILRDIADSNTFPLTPDVESEETHDPRDLRAAACGALIHFPSEVEESKQVWLKGLFCYGHENIRAACFIGLVETCFSSEASVRKSVVSMICRLGELKCGFSPEREASLYLERLSEFKEFSSEIVFPFLEPQNLWVTTEWDSNTPALADFVGSSFFGEREKQRLLRKFSSFHHETRRRSALLLAHVDIQADLVCNTLATKIWRQSDRTLEAIAYAESVLSAHSSAPKLLGDSLQKELDARDKFVEDLNKGEASIYSRIIWRLKAIWRREFTV